MRLLIAVLFSPFLLVGAVFGFLFGILQVAILAGQSAVVDVMRWLGDFE